MSDAAGRPLRVLFVNENIGGHRTLHLNLARALQDHPEVDARFLHVPSPGLVRRIGAVPVPGLARLDLDLQPLRYQLGQSLATRRMLPELLADIDVVHVYTHNVALVSHELLRRVPTVVSLDATNAQNALALPYRRPTRFTLAATRPVMALERRVYRSAEAVVTHSQWAARSVAEYGVDPARIHVVPFGITVPDVPDVPRSHPPRIVFVARTMDRKGGWRLLDVFRRHFADRAQLTIVTTDAVPPSPGVEVIDDIVPGDPRLPEILASASVFAFPTEMDPFGYAPIEAMAMGLPVVASRLNALPEIIDHGRTGLLVPTGDDDALRDALVSLLDDPERAQEMGRAGRQVVLDRFDARVTTAALVDVLRAAAGRARAG